MPFQKNKRAKEFIETPKEKIERAKDRTEFL